MDRKLNQIGDGIYNESDESCMSESEDESDGELLVKCLIKINRITTFPCSQMIAMAANSKASKARKKKKHRSLEPPRPHPSKENSRPPL